MEIKTYRQSSRNINKEKNKTAERKEIWIRSFKNSASENNATFGDSYDS